MRDPSNTSSASERPFSTWSKARVTSRWNPARPAAPGITQSMPPRSATSALWLWPYTTTRVPEPGAAWELVAAYKDVGGLVSDHVYIYRRPMNSEATTDDAN